MGSINKASDKQPWMISEKIRSVIYSYIAWRLVSVYLAF